MCMPSTEEVRWGRQFLCKCNFGHLWATVWVLGPNLDPLQEQHMLFQSYVALKTFFFCCVFSWHLGWFFFFFSLFCFLGLCMFQTLDTNLFECIAGKDFLLSHGLSLRSIPFVDCDHNACVAGVLFEKSLPVPAHWNILPTFSSDSFRVSSIMLRWFCAGDR